MFPCRHKPRNVGHVHHKAGAHLLRRSGETGKVDGTAVRRRAGDDELGPQRKRHALHTVVVDEAVIVHIVEVQVVEFAGEVHRRAVGQMTAVGEAHGQHGVAGLQQSHVGRQIGRRAAVGLDVDVVVGGKDLLPLGDAVLLQLIHDMAAAVVPALIAHGPVGRIPL